MTLLESVAAALESAGIAFALIGAGALAVHRVARATGDIDLLTVAPEALSPATWRTLREQGVESGLADLGESARAAWRQLRGD